MEKHYLRSQSSQDQKKVVHYLLLLLFHIYWKSGEMTEGKEKSRDIRIG